MKEDSMVLIAQALNKLVIVHEKLGEPNVYTLTGAQDWPMLAIMLGAVYLLFGLMLSLVGRYLTGTVASRLDKLETAITAAVQTSRSEINSRLDIERRNCGECKSSLRREISGIRYDRDHESCNNNNNNNNVLLK